MAATVNVNGRVFDQEHAVISVFDHGFLYGEGQGIISTQEGDMVTWKGQGAGKMKPGGGASYRGAIYFQNGSGKLARLNGTAAVFEHESDANDNVTSKYWEWK